MLSDRSSRSARMPTLEPIPAIPPPPMQSPKPPRRSEQYKVCLRFLFCSASMLLQVYDELLLFVKYNFDSFDM